MNEKEESMHALIHGAFQDVRFSGLICGPPDVRYIQVLMEHCHRAVISTLFSTAGIFISFCNLAMGQGIPQTTWYSETNKNGIVIQNSFPKGGPYTGSARGKNFNYSFLIFYTRVVNDTTTSMELTIEFPADSFAIPSSPDVFVKLFLPPDTMTHDKLSKYNYGVTGLESFLEFNRPTLLKRTINPKEELLVYIGTVFYQTKSTEAFQERGGNRAELVLKGQNLIYRMPPQIDSLLCGHIIFEK